MSSTIAAGRYSRAWNRLERLQQGFGIPLPASTQWEVVHDAARRYDAVYSELIHQAANGQVLYNDDTTMKVLELDDPERRKELDTDGDFEGRTGVFTSGIVATKEQHQIALFFTGQKHAGENLTDLLAQRDAELSPPIQMCDGLARNLPEDFATLLARCNAHNRRNFLDVEASFPDEVRHVPRPSPRSIATTPRPSSRRSTPMSDCAFTRRTASPFSITSRDGSNRSRRADPRSRQATAERRWGRLLR